MFRILCAAGLLAAALPQRGAAAVLSRDWKTPGDGLLTYDDVNRREWLDLSVSAMNQFPSPHLPNALAQLQPGGLFDGFTFATRTDLIALALSGGVDITTDSYSVNGLSISTLVTLLSSTIQTSQSIRSLGYIDERSMDGRQLGGDLFFETPSGGTAIAGVEFHVGGDLLPRPTSGLFIFRYVPEPSSFYPASYLIVLYVLRRTRQAQ